MGHTLPCLHTSYPASSSMVASSRKPSLTTHKDPGFPLSQRPDYGSPVGMDLGGGCPQEPAGLRHTPCPSATPALALF